LTDFKRLTKEECANLLLSAKSPTVVMHVRPDGDTVGTAIALIRTFEALGKEATYLCKDKIPERLRFILGDARQNEAPTGDIITVDVASPSQAGGLLDRLTAPLFAIDHHAVNTPFAPNYTVEGASSAAEALMDVLEVLEKRGLLKITPYIAEPLYTAISSDTGCFCFSNTTEKTHMRAARLLSFGIDAATINRLLFSSKSEGQIKAEGLVASKLKSLQDGKIRYVTVSRREREALGIPFEEFETAIDVVRSVKGTVIAIAVKETDEGAFKASLRSTSPNVAEIAAQFGGGGHALAAGCTLSGESIEGATAALLQKLTNMK